jgi:hypothetical protein
MAKGESSCIISSFSPIALQSSPEPLPDLLGRWQGYLEESMNRLRKFYTWRELENRWQQNLMAEAYFHGPPEISDEEIIRYWDHCLRNHAIFGGGSREAKKNGV